MAVSLVANAGDARSDAIEALREAKAGNLEEARTILERGRKSLGMAHVTQLNLLSSEARGDAIEITLLMVHAQDHFMNALTMLDIANECIEVFSKVHEATERGMGQ